MKDFIEQQNQKFQEILAKEFKDFDPSPWRIKEVNTLSETSTYRIGTKMTYAQAPDSIQFIMKRTAQTIRHTIGEKCAEAFNGAFKDENSLCNFKDKTRIYVAADLSPTSLQFVLEGLEINESLVCTHTCVLLVPPQQTFIADETIRQYPKKLQDRITKKVNPFLVDSDAWFVIRDDHELELVMRKLYEGSVEDCYREVDFDTNEPIPEEDRDKAILVSAYSRFLPLVKSNRGIVGSPGA